MNNEIDRIWERFKDRHFEDLSVPSDTIWETREAD
jgi:hypothetical protein